MSGTPLHEIIRVRQRFARSANIERDANNDIQGYLPTGRALDVLVRLAAGLADPSAGRAISVTGPYGSGKSSLGLFLIALLGPAVDPSRRLADQILQEADASVALQLAHAREAVGAGWNGFIRAAVTAQHEPIAATVLRALRVGVLRFAGGEVEARKTPAFEELLSADIAGIRTAADLRHLLASVASVAPVLLVIDEFGKTLEHLAASMGTANDDLYLLQDLAEWAEGATALPVAMLTFQHLAFEDYVSGASTAQRREWSKILGRFVDIPYVEAASQAQALAGSVFEQSTRAVHRERLQQWGTAMADAADSLGLGTILHLPPERAYPLHPLTLAALPDLCARYGQNERTLFSFLAGPDPLAVPAFLAEARAQTDEQLPSVRLDRVYDYFLESASTMIGVSATASRWMEIETRIRDAQGISDAERRIVKAVGVLNLVSAGGTLRASRSLLTFACADGNLGTETEQAVEAWLVGLEARGLVTYRAFADEYRIWRGTDFDMKGAVELARRRMRDEPVAAVLQRVRPLPPVVAARHSQETGTLRIFERRYVDRWTQNLAPLTSDDSGDGLALICVDPDNVLPAGLAVAADAKPIVVGLTHGSARVSEAAREFAAHVDVLNTTEDLESDWVARKELRERSALAMRELDAALETAFGPRNRTVRWLRLIEPEPTPLGAMPSLSMALSRLCDELYPDTPRIRNEMLARRDLTSQGARARRDLLEAMVEYGAEPLLRLDGFGPERAMYEAVLARPGIHRSRRGNWTFGPPKPSDELNYGPAWAAVERALESAGDRRVGLDEVFERLMAPPLGLKDGPLPVLVTAALLAHADDVALYEEGTFVARLTADMVERLARNPNRFALKSYMTQGARGRVIRALAEALGVGGRLPSRTRVPSVVGIVAPLLTHIRSLSAYARVTKHASSKALAVRAALLQAREPDELLFRALPEALGYPHFEARGAIADDAARSYATDLATAVNELHGLDAALRDHVRTIVAEGLGSPLEDLRQDARTRAARLVERVLEPQLRAFTFTLATPDLRDDEWLNLLAMQVASKAIDSWTDDDRARFGQRCLQITSAFRRLENLHFQQLEVPSDAFDVVRLAVTRPDGEDTSRVLWVDESAREVLQAFVDEIRSRAQSIFGHRGEDMLLAALAGRMLQEDPGTVLFEEERKDRPPRANRTA